MYAIGYSVVGPTRQQGLLVSGQSDPALITISESYIMDRKFAIETRGELKITGWYSWIDLYPYLTYFLISKATSVLQNGIICRTVCFDGLETTDL